MSLHFFRHALVKTFLRQQARVARRAGNTERAEKLRASLDNPEVCEAVCGFCCDAYDAYQAEATKAGSPLTDFLEWLLAHADEIIAFIEMIIDLFTAQARAEAERPRSA